MKQVTIFTSKNCAPCAQVKPILYAIHGQYKFDLTIVEATPNTQATFEEHRVRAVPTIIVLDGDKEIGRVQGSQTKASLEEFFRKIQVI